jgi:hypothetical protein
MFGQTSPKTVKRPIHAIPCLFNISSMKMMRNESERAALQSQKTPHPLCTPLARKVGEFQTFNYFFNSRGNL